MHLSDASFQAITVLFERESGIALRPDKRHLVTGRLNKRALQLGIGSLDDYVMRVLDGDVDEQRRVVDALTTNETYFFREPQHFDHLSQWLRSTPGSSRLRIWSAASSSGEEAYTLAMVLARHASQRAWEVVGTDLSETVIEQAARGLYVAERCRLIPPDDLKRWCLKGTGDYEGQVLVHRKLRERVRFMTANLMDPPASIGSFDVAFLRNVLIYFDGPAKQHIVRQVASRVTPGGLLYTGHAESLKGLDVPLETLQPSIYRVVHRAG